MTFRRPGTFLLVALILGLTSTGLAQSDRGTIIGTVTDPNGAFVAGETVTITSLDSADVRVVQTRDDGTYTVPELKAAPYKITIEAQGFKTATLDRVQVAVQITRRADVKLEVGAIGESVIVS